MVLDFIEEVDGYLQHSNEQARVYLHHKMEGYFTNILFIEQVKKAIDIFELKYPGVPGLFIFDNAPSHRKMPDDSLNHDRMNVRDGCSQPFMRDTEWNGKVQYMVLADGKQKGLRHVLEERGVDVTGMNAACIQETLKTFSDFKCSLSIVEEVVEERNHMCMFLPRFHCELNPIE